MSEATATQAGWIDQDTYRTDCGKLFKGLAGGRKLDLPTAFYRWADGPCRWLGGRKIETMEVPNFWPYGYPAEVTVYSLDDLEAIKAAIAAAKLQGDIKGTVHYKDKNGDWLTRLQLCRKREVNTGWVDGWAEKPSKLRIGEKALRRKDDIKNRTAYGPPTLTVYCDMDAVACIEGKESSRPLKTGPVELHAGKLEKAQESAVKVLSALLDAGPMKSAEVRRRLRLAALSWQLLWHARRELKIRCRRKGPVGPFYWCLPDQDPPASSAVGKTKKDILSLLQDRGPLTLSSIASVLRKKGISKNAAKLSLLSMRRQDKVRVEREGPRCPYYWRLPDQKSPTGTERPLPGPSPAAARMLELVQKRGKLSAVEAGKLLNDRRAASGKTPLIYPSHAATKLLRVLARRGLIIGDKGAYCVSAGQDEPSMPAIAAADNVQRQPAATRGRPAGAQKEEIAEFVYYAREKRNEDGSWTFKYSQIRADVSDRWNKEISNAYINVLAFRYAADHGKLFTPRM
jgi:hypothetical protein